MTTEYGITSECQVSWSNKQGGNKYVALSLMYFAQGIPSGLAFNALGPLIRQSGHPISDVGMAGFASFAPWALKILWAGPMDTACSRWGYARLIGITQALIVLICLGISGFPPDNYLTYALIGIVALNTVSATQDIVTNAYAITHFQGRAAGSANAIQIAAFLGGMLAGGGGFLFVHAQFGWTTAMLCLAALFTSLYVPLVFGRNLTDSAGRRDTWKHVKLRDLLLHADLKWALCIAFLYKFSGTSIATLVQPWLIDRHWTLTQVGTLQMNNLFANALGGTLIGIPIIRWLGNRRATLVTCCLLAALLCSPLAIQEMGIDNHILVYSIFSVQSLAEGAMFVAVLALLMNWASPSRPGTDYTAVQCCESLANASAAGMIGNFGQRYGYTDSFACAWIAGVVMVMVIGYCLPRVRLVDER